jgi:hypothetical protein
MRVIGAIAACLVLIAGGVLAFWTFGYPTYTYRYRLTVEAMVGGSIHSGSGVIEIELRTQPRTSDIPPVAPRVHGDAVFVDLGGGRNVVALLAGGAEAKDWDQPINLVPSLFPPIDARRDELARFTALRGRSDVPERLLPTLATFDLGDPANARVVRPGEFEAVFGPGVRFQRVWIEMTDEPVTRGIEQKLAPIWNGPFPWQKPTGRGSYVDTRPPGFRWNKGMLRRDF